MPNEDLAFPVEQILTLPDTVPLTTREVAAVTRLGEGTLRKWACWKREGDLLPYIKRGGKNLYKPSQVREFLGLNEAVAS